jgi:Ni/Co efflux regulator RcnB
MKSTLIAALALGVTLVAANTSALADDHDGHDGHDNHPFVKHAEWKKGARMRDDDWKRGERIDYREHHLRAPPHGYEWREVDGNYVLAAVATGVIASVVAASLAGH